MCLINFAWNAHDKYKLIVAANRDEFLDRRTASLNRWEEEKTIIAGKDLEKHGTWLGISESGKFSALTNVRKIENKTYERSRGELVLNYLSSDETIEAYAKQLSRNAHEYPGYNLLLSDFQHLCYISNQHGHDQLIYLEDGVYSLSNADLYANWPKMKRGKQLIETILQEKDEDKIIETLLSGLKNRKKARDAELPKTGVGIDMERSLSAMFIDMDGYGTRSSTVVLVDDKGCGLIVELTYENGHERRVQFQFSLPAHGLNKEQ